MAYNAVMCNEGAPLLSGQAYSSLCQIHTLGIPRQRVAHGLARITRQQYTTTEREAVQVEQAIQLTRNQIKIKFRDRQSNS